MAFTSAFTGAQMDAAFAAAAQASFSYDQITPTIEASTNVTSISDDGSGVYTATYTNAFADALWKGIAGTGVRPDDRTQQSMGLQQANQTNDNRTTTTFAGRSKAGSTPVAAEGALDNAHNMVVVFGDLA